MWAIPENNERGRTGTPVQYPDSAAKGFADQLEYRAQSGRAGGPLHPKVKQRSLDALRWGLIPYWAKDPKIAFKTINAKTETVDPRRLTGKHSENVGVLFRLMAFMNGARLAALRFPFRLG